MSSAFAWFYVHPISNDVVHTRVLKHLERVSGLKVSYDSASLTLSTGRYKIENLRFTDPETSSPPVLTVGEVTASINPWELITHPESVIGDVVLKNPSQFSLQYSAGSIRLGERTKFLLDAVEKAQPPGSRSSGHLPFDKLTIENAEVGFTEAPDILPELSPTEPAMVLSGNVVVTNHGRSALDIRFSGHAAGPEQFSDLSTSATMAGGIEAVATVHDSGLISVQGKMKSLALTQIFRDMPATTLHGENIDFDAEAGSKDGLHTIKGQLTAGGLSYDSPEKNVSIADADVDLTTELDIDTSSGQTVVRSLALKSDGANLGMKGRFEFKRPFTYDLELTANGLNRDYRTVLKDLLPKGWDVETGRDGLALDVHAAGNDTRISKLEGGLVLNGVSLKTPTLPATLKRLSGDVHFDDRLIRFSKVTGSYAGANVALDGTFSGDPWRTRTGSLDLNWSTVIELNEVLKLHQKQLTGDGEKISGSGKMSGRGTWKQKVDFRNPAESEVPTVQGNIDFNDVSLKYALLPAPIAGLNGKTRIVNNRLEVEDLSGSMQGSKLSVDGYMEGDQYFWKDPQVSATLHSRMDLSQLAPYLTKEQENNLHKYQLSGIANTEMLMNGPLDDLGKKFTGVVKISDVDVTPNLEFMTGKFTGISGVATWNGVNLHLEKISGRLNDQEIGLSGDISRNRVSLNVKSDASLSAVGKTFPRLDKYLDMKGSALCDLRFSMGEETKSAPDSLTHVFEAARVLAEKAVEEKSFALNGSLRFKDASLRHIAMPAARNERGRKLPDAWVTDLNGSVRVKNDSLIVPDDDPLKCAFADTPNCRLSGSIKIRPQNFPAMRVKISSAGTLKLDSWITGWGKALPDLKKPLITGKEYDLDAMVMAPSVLFRGQHAGRSQANVKFKMVQNESPRITELNDVVVQGDRPEFGRIIGNGRIESYVWDKAHFPRWSASLDVQAMPIESMLAAIFESPANLRGMITGKISLSGISNDPRSIRGNGNGFMRNLALGGTAVIRQLGQTTGRNFGGMLFETAQAATFDIGNGALSSRDLTLQTNGLQLDVRGDYWFAGDPARGVPPKTIDGSLRMRLFKSVFGSIPIIGQVADLADEVANAFLLAFRVTGTSDHPRVTPVALPVLQGGA